ncbi:MAG: hypothetical protein E7474_03240 [Ruminococcaceae bacterium]|nr:hypothetical protein [Oscillospiraceae bacterium]
MVIGIIGENCSGKSTLAGEISRALGAEVVTGRDYLRLAKTESEAEALFRDKLRRAVSEGNVIYVISEPELLKLLPEGAIRILVSADLDTIKERFRARMHGGLPAPVEAMLEKKHGMFDDGNYSFRFDGASGDAASLCAELQKHASAPSAATETASA